MGIRPPRGDLASAALTFGEGGLLLFQDPGAVTPLMAAEMIAQAIPGVRGPWEDGKGAGAPFFFCMSINRTEWGDIHRVQGGRFRGGGGGGGDGYRVLRVWNLVSTPLSYAAGKSVRGNDRCPRR